MTALSSAYTSLTGLIAFSRALDIIGDNVANLNTVGFKATDLTFESLPPPEGSQNDSRPAAESEMPGGGAVVTGTQRRFTPGELRETGTATHVAVSGDGFFVLSDGDRYLYTRNGQFQLDKDGNLQDASGKRNVQALVNGVLQDIVIDSDKTNPASATKTVEFSGILSLNQASTGTGANAVQRFTLDSVKVFDVSGVQQTLKMEFTRTPSGGINIWTVSVKDSAGLELLAANNKEIRFDGAGNPTTDFSTLKFKVKNSEGVESEVTLDFKRANSFSSIDISSLAVSKSDGYALGRLSSFSFDEKGKVTLQFSNGQKEDGQRLALATFSDPQLLDTSDGGLFIAPEGTEYRLGLADEDGFGSIRPRSLELANVELAREFADILILQRGFQASSQVLNVTSKMIEDIYNSVSGRG
ncbi:flagellar basal-body rod protein FlgF [Solimonas sp. K1W22B-7]|uniref:flagellar basal-body rod protein FlgF n=1 Tax=Solimonas sp. K1W22B-7 TaxID=2303331 RepID=UPI000E335AC4|nr:flagellar basal-body rod protein FlgF [Solimonas sp. K1W22B-7]AXQ28065.1 flagellar basal-body rod protein FlgF [Solimonas sp. K1W22B-7]